MAGPICEQRSARGAARQAHRVPNTVAASVAKERRIVEIMGEIKAVLGRE